eukprot:7949386-Pyramimonas_sp.AAC.1
MGERGGLADGAGFRGHHLFRLFPADRGRAPAAVRERGRWRRGGAFWAEIFTCISRRALPMGVAH